MTKDLSLCSVGYRTRSLLELNRELTDDLNPGALPEWLVVENTPPGEPERLDDNRGGSFRFQVLSGSVPRSAVPNGSYHHAKALHQALAQVHTRFVAILDPDFFLVRPNWATEIPRYMEERGLGVFGAPYHPMRRGKYRYFPCVSCMFVDRSRVRASDLNFSPGYRIDPRTGAPVTPDPDDLGYRRLKAIQGVLLEQKRGAARRGRVGERLARALDALLELLVRREATGASLDTGYAFYRRCAGRIQSECAIPVFRTADDYMDRLERLARAALPDSWCRVPKRRGYFSTTGFRELGLVDLDARGWEEYLWRQAPFGFHIRGVSQGLKRVESDEVREVVRRFRALALRR